MKRVFIIGLVILVILIAGFFIFKNLNNTSEEQKIIQEALKLYSQKKAEGMNFSSQCLGVIDVGGVGYAVDIVHVPRTEEDNRPENQCEDYRLSRVNHFIELDKEGSVVRIK